MIITAQWSINQYTITFDSDGGSNIAPITQDCGTQITVPEEPTKPGYIFIGWEPAVPSTMPAENLTLTAIWLPGTTTLTISVGVKENQYIDPDQTFLYRITDAYWMNLFVAI